VITAPTMMWVIPSVHSPVAMSCLLICTAAQQGIIAVAQRNIPSLRSFAQEDLVILALIPDYFDRKEVEMSKDAWPLVREVIRSLTIAVESGASESQMASRPFPTEKRVVAAVAQPVLLLFNRVTALAV